MSLRQLARAALAALLLVGGMQAAGAATAPVRQQAAVSHTLAFGLDLKHAQHQSDQAAVQAAEATLGRTLAFTRDFLLWDSAFPTSYERWLGARGTVPMISVKARLANGTAVPWAAIATAAPGSALYAQMTSWVQRLKDFGYPVYFTLNHEPEAATNDDLGTPADFVAAWRRMHDLIVAAGAGNVRFMWIMTSWAFKVPSTDRRYAADWYPGDGYVDGIAADAYNWSDCRYANGKWESLATVINGFVAFGRAHPTIPLWLTEFATVEGSTGEKAQWIDDARTLLTQPAYSQIVGVSYFDQLQPGSPCGWPTSTSISATQGITTMANDAAYQGSALPVVGSPAPSSISFVGAASTTANARYETVTVPAAVRAGDALVLVGSDASPAAVTAPAGWTSLPGASSATMVTTAWQRVATAADAGSRVSVDFGAIRKGSVELLAYRGTDPVRPVRLAVAAASDTAASTLTTPRPGAANAGELLVSYWAGRTSVDAALRLPTGSTQRSAESGTGGGRVVSASADSDPLSSPGGRSAPGALAATISASAGHSVTWSLLLAPAS